MPARFTVDADMVRKLAELLRETGLGEIEYAEGDKRIRVAQPAMVAPAPAAAAAPLAVATASAGAGAPAAPLEGTITSPMVGTAYLTPEPGAPPFVKVGDKVKEGQTLLIIEAMKVMNPIRCPRAGTVQQVIVASGTPVEYGEPLMVVA